MRTTPEINLGTVLAVGARESRISTGTPPLTHHLYTVSRLTETQAVAVGEVGELRVWRKNLKVVGQDYSYAAIATDEMQAAHYAQVAVRIRHRASVKLIDDLLDKRLHQLDLTVTQLEALAKAWTDIKLMA